MHLKATGIDHVNLAVINLDESCTFWKKLLGFKVLEDIPEQQGRIIGTHETKLALYESEKMKKGDIDGFAHIGFHIENYNEIEAKCKELNIAIMYGEEVQWKQSKSIYIKDPNGYEIELAEVWGGGL